MNQTVFFKMLRPLDRKLLRDLWRVKGQAGAIAVVISLGVMMMVMMQGLINTLDETQRAYYERYRLSTIFAPVKRAPNSVLKNIAAIPGVSVVEGRINGGAMVDVPGSTVPVRARAVSLPDERAPKLNDIYLSAGRLLDPTKRDEVLLLEGFSKAWGLKVGDEVTATMNGKQRAFTIAGIAQSPEFLVSVAPGELAPDDARFAVIWMGEEALAAAYDLDGGFNEVNVSLARGASVPAVLAQMDRILSPYGGKGAYHLDDQLSNRFLSQELDGLRATNGSIPPIFLAVAAFLLYIVATRMVQAEREQIGLMKAFGYTGVEVGLHYFKFILIISVLGAVLGCGLGIMAGRSLAQFYQLYFKFPFLVFQVDYGSFFTGLFVSVATASAGGVFVLRQVLGMNPAVAMRPPAPADYSRSGALAASLKKVLDQPSRMVLRRLLRQPGRAFVAIVGIAGGMALSVAMLSVMASFDRTIDLNFNVIDRSDVTVTFVEPLSDKALYNLGRMEGVTYVEPFRVVSAVFRNGFHTYRTGINGLLSQPILNRAVDDKMKPIYVREDGVVLSTGLAEILNIKAGDMLTVEVREGLRPTLQLPVVEIAESLIGSPAYFELAALNRALKEPGRVSGAFLSIDQSHSDQIYTKLKDMPAIAGVSLRSEVRAAMKKMMDMGAGAMRYVMATIATVITFGIVYNSARIAFAERARDLASLRVIGFTKGEAAFVLLGEMAVITLAALPLGILFGYGMAIAVSAGFSTDLYRVTPIYSPDSYGAAIVAVVFASVLSGWIVKRDADRIDMVMALKIRE
ncbi:MAG: ABC transporter permease [Alphaproteobacteria bacterium]